MKRFNPIKAAGAPPSAAPLTAPRKAKPAVANAAAFTVTLSENERGDGLQLRFPSKPDDHVLNDLKTHGWRWSRLGFWYHRNTPENRTYANRFLDANGGRPQEVPAVASIPVVPVVPAAAPMVAPEPQNIVPVAFAPTPAPVSVAVRTDIPAWKRAFLRR